MLLERVSLNQALPKALDLSPHLFRSTGIVEDGVRKRPLVIQRLLRALPGRKLLFAPTARQGTLEPRRWRTIHKNQLCTAPAQTDFQQQSGVQDDHLDTSRSHRLDLLPQAANNFPMGDFFQVLPFAFSIRPGGKDNASQTRAIDPTIGSKDTRSPSLTGCCFDLGQTQYFMSDTIRVYQASPKFGQLSGHHALTAGNAAQ
jgi:hypothetical protein